MSAIGVHRVDRRRRRRADRGHDRDRSPAGGAILRDRRRERRRVHGSAPVVRRRSARTAGPPEAQRHARLLDRAVRLRRGVDAQPAGPRPASPARPRRRPAPPGARPRGRSACDVEAVSVSSPSKPSGSPSASRSQPTTTPSSSVADRRRPPEHRVLPRASTVSISPRMPGPDAVVAKVGEEARMLPVRDVRLDRGGGRRRGSRPGAPGPRAACRAGARRSGPGLDRRQDRVALEVCEVVGHDGRRPRGRPPGTPPESMSLRPESCSGSRRTSSLVTRPVYRWANASDASPTADRMSETWPPRKTSAMIERIASSGMMSKIARQA